jgi:hypothetical protein
MSARAGTALPSLEGGWLTMAEACAPLCGVTPKTVRNHVVHGTRTARGRVRLEARLLGGHYYTKREWIDAYLAATTAAAIGDDAGATLRPEPAGKQAARFAAEQAEAARRLGGTVAAAG